MYDSKRCTVLDFANQLSAKSYLNTQSRAIGLQYYSNVNIVQKKKKIVMLATLPL